MGAVRGFGSSTRLCPLARCGPCVALRPISFPFDRQYCLPILQGAGRLATSVPIFLMLFVFPTYSFSAGAVRVRIGTRTPHLWRGGTHSSSAYPRWDQVRGTLVGAQASLCFARSDLVAPAARARSEQHRTHAPLPKTFEHHHSASPADLHRLSLDVGVYRYAVLKTAIALPVARRANEERSLVSISSMTTRNIVSQCLQ